jgi:hypothetical protein
MKRLIAAVALAVSAGAVMAETGAPFEQNELDRMLPSLPDNVASYSAIPASSLPFEQTQFDRGDSASPESVKLAQVGAASYKSDEGSESVWANDHNFVSPAQ